MADHYDVSVNKDDLNARNFARELNERHEDGWKLNDVFEQNGNTVMVWERRA
jgi:hypothetical protein